MKERNNEKSSEKGKDVGVFHPFLFHLYGISSPLFFTFISSGDSLSVPSTAAVSNAECNTSLLGK
ncbi:hypothetical protein [Hoylesella saccharolytica]|uniref:hypothetical protein n=1 Tax=Hoylesella saccharolytica TaxID=633701 RepID=UPI00046F2B35|nr:hypothetical protein [Hoylesella saccharolytica]